MGGKAFENVGRIKKEQIPKTLEYLSDITEIALDYLEDNLLGSTGKSATSGDIDIALGAMWNEDALEDILRLELGVGNIRRLPAMNILSCSVPIEGNKDNGFVQIDFMFTTNPTWTKFSFYSDGDKSQYKGVHRTLFLSALAAFRMKNDYEYVNGKQLLVKSNGYVWSPAKGLSLVYKARKRDKAGNYLKTFDNEHTGYVINNPTEVVNYLFHSQFYLPQCSGIHIEDAASVEKIYAAVLNKFTKEDVEKILSIYRERLESAGVTIPEFMQESS